MYVVTLIFKLLKTQHLQNFILQYSIVTLLL